MDEAEEAGRREMRAQFDASEGIRPMLIPGESKRTAADKKLLEDAIGDMGRRLKPCPGPDVPESVWAEAHKVRRVYPEDCQPLVDKIVASGTTPEHVLDALVERRAGSLSSRSDTHSGRAMVIVGEHIYQTNTEDGIQEHLQSLVSMLYSAEDAEYLTMEHGLLSSPQKLAELVSLVIDIFLDKARPSDLEEDAMLLNGLDIGKLRSAASEVDLETFGGKPALIVRLVEFIYDDVLFPPQPREMAQSLAEMAEEKLIRSLDKNNVKEYLQAAQGLERAKLKSACLGLIRENYAEMLADSKLVSMIEKENETLWYYLIKACRKRKRE